MIRILALAVLLVGGAWASEEAAHGEEAHGGGDPLLMWKWVNFGILAAGIGYAIVKFGGPAVRERRQEILDALNAGQRRSEEAAAQAKAIDRKMAGLQAEVESLRVSAKEEMRLEAERIRKETIELLAKVERNAQQEIASAAKEATHNLKVYSAHLALELARQKVAGRMTPELQAQLVGEFVRGMDQAEGRNN